MRAIFASAVLLGAVLAAPAYAGGGPAGPAEAMGPWVEAQSPHFIVLTDANEKEARRIAGQLEQMRAVFQSLFPNMVSDADLPIRVLAVRDRKEFQTVEPAAYLGKDKLDLAGLFMQKQDDSLVLLRLDTAGEHPFATVYHEYTHYLTRHATWIPLWMSEGLAEFYQNTEIDDKQVKIGQPSVDDIMYLQENKLLPLPTLFAVDHSSPYYHEEQKGSVFYAESWALTHYLMMNDMMNHTHLMMDYSLRLIHNDDPVTAAQHAFGDLNALQTALGKYVRQEQYRYFKMNVVSTVDPNTFKVRTVPMAEANAERAEVLVYSQRPADAEALLGMVLQDDPKSAQAHEAMGFLKSSQSDIAAAQKWYGEAVQLHSSNYLTYYYDAVMTMQSDDRTRDDIVESDLRAVIKMNPKYAAAYSALAMFYGQRNKNLDEAHMLSVQAVQMDPANVAYRLNAAAVLAQQGRFGDAENALKIALSLADDAGEKTMIQSRIDELEVMKNPRPETARNLTSGSGPQTVMIEGKKVEAVSLPDGPKYPAGEATGPQHTVKGVIHGVECTYPAVLALHLYQGSRPITLYSNNYFKTPYSATNFVPSGDLNPCRDLDGMRASIVYAEVSDKAAAGQIVSIALTK